MWPFKKQVSGLVQFEAPPLDEFACQNYLVILPAWNEAPTIGNLVKELRGMHLNVLVVDDGSQDETFAAAEEAGATVIRHETNQGKGHALADGFRYAAKEGYDAVVTLDADGQHNPGDVSRFFDTYNRTGIPVLVGNRFQDRHRMTRASRMTNGLMSRLLNRRMQQYIPDTQNGFRLYQTDVVMMVIPESKGFTAQSEILIRLDEIDIRMGSVPVAATYEKRKGALRSCLELRMLFMLLKRRFSR